MLEYNLDIQKTSTWILTTQNPSTRAMPFYISEIGRFQAGEGYFTRRSGRGGYYLVFTHGGRGMLHTGNAAHDLPAGRAILISCMPPHRYHTAGEHWDHSWMHLDGSGAASLCTLLEQAPVALAQPQEFAKQFAAVAALASQIDLAAAAQISHGISALLTAMLTSRLAAGSAREADRHASIGPALRFIEERYPQALSIDDIARHVNLSKYHFVRLFRAQVGMAPYSYLTHHRINQAKRLLCSSDLAVNEIARRVGFPNESNFIHQFRQFCGTTPAQFRKSNIHYRYGQSTGTKPD